MIMPLSSKTEESGFKLLTTIPINTLRSGKKKSLTVIKFSNKSHKLIKTETELAPNVPPLSHSLLPEPGSGMALSLSLNPAPTTASLCKLLTPSRIALGWRGIPLKVLEDATRHDPAGPGTQAAQGLYASLVSLPQDTFLLIFLLISPTLSCLPLLSPAQNGCGPACSRSPVTKDGFSQLQVNWHLVTDASGNVHIQPPVLPAPALKMLCHLHKFFVQKKVLDCFLPDQNAAA